MKGAEFWKHRGVGRGEGGIISIWVFRADQPTALERKI